MSTMAPVKPHWRESNGFAILAVLAALVVVWYVAAVLMNWQGMTDLYQRKDVTGVTVTQQLYDVLNYDKPLLPAPHQVVAEFWKTTVEQAVTSKKSLVYHGWITLSATLLGFVIGTGFGIGLAVLIVHNGAMDRSLMPWIIASQTIPILAIAPMVIVVLNAVGISGLVPKALISTYLSFFPVVVGMVKGFRSPEAIQLDLMHTYNASRVQTFLKLRWPIALPYLFTSMKVGVAASLVGAIVGELPAGGGNGLGARLLAGSYYGQTIQIWSALLTASLLAGALIALVTLAERMTNRSLGARA
ncbi:ABC transporter permease [Devosia sp.]|uniref:ABC transporter permease n=1 Tax=Devosia sp. TaxID=1871048 RepID=UPI003BABA94C